jgi:hypothetical protein
MRKQTTLILIMLLTSCNNLVSNSVIKESNKPVEVNESIKPSILPSEIPKVVPSLPVQSSNPVQSGVKNEPKVDTSIKQSGTSQVVIPSIKPSTTPSNSPNLTGNISPEPELKLIKIEESDGIIYYYKEDTKEKIPKYAYKKYYPLPKIIIGNYFSLGFDDSYKIRFNKEKNEFYSLVGKNLDELNSIFKLYIVKKITPYAEGLDVTYFEELERKGKEEDPNYNFVGILSEYIIKVEDNSKLKDLILKLRDLDFVKFADYNVPKKVDKRKEKEILFVRVI